MIDKLLIHDADRGGNIIHYNMRFLFKSCRCAVDANCRSQAVHIHHLMPHNKDRVIDSNKFAECFCFYSGLYPRIFGGLLPFASVVSNAAAVLNNRLISSSCQSQINGCPGIGIALHVSSLAKSETDT